MLCKTQCIKKANGETNPSTLLLTANYCLTTTVLLLSAVHLKIQSCGLKKSTALEDDDMNSFSTKLFVNGCHI